VSWRRSLRIIGPGLVLAATGVGAGDLVAASVSGARYGFAVVWAAALGALLKYVLNEGVARWQLATGLFMFYLVVWSFVVAGALIGACGLAAHSLVPAVSFEAWGVIHSLAAALLVLVGRYASFEKLIGLFIGLMSVTLIGSALFVAPPLESLTSMVSEAALPRGSTPYVMGVLGGVGGTVTLLLYGYWIRERGWEGPRHLGTVRLDLAVAYVLTGAFGIAVMLLAARVLHADGIEIQGKTGVISMAAMLGEVMGPVGHWTFLIGFWGAMATSMLGVWQGVPYLFSNFVALSKKPLPPDRTQTKVDTRSISYRGFLMWLCLPPLALLKLDRPIGLVIVYAALGALFLPFLASTLIYLNSRRSLVGEELRSRWWTNAILCLAVALFLYLGFLQLSSL